MAKKLKPTHRHIKHWFVPHKHNDHRPHLIRLHGLAVVAFLVIGVQITFNLTRPAASRVLAYATDITTTALLNQTNQQRAANGLPALSLNAKLNQSASLKAGNMFAENYWAHVSPSGLDPWHWFAKAGYAYAFAGENLAKDFDTTSGTVQGWMNSPGHRANILNSNYTEVGFAVQNGTLTGGQTTLVVAHYAKPVGGGTSVAATVPAAAAPKAAAPVAATPKPAVPAPTAAPEPSVTPSPAPSVTPVAVASVGTGTPAASAPAPKQYSLFQPLSIVRTLNWGTLATMAILFLLLVVYLLTHITVWRKGLKRWQTTHYKMFAATQVSMLVLAIVALAVSGFGQVS